MAGTLGCPPRSGCGWTGKGQFRDKAYFGFAQQLLELRLWQEAVVLHKGWDLRGPLALIVHSAVDLHVLVQDGQELLLPLGKVRKKWGLNLGLEGTAIPFSTQPRRGNVNGTGRKGGSSTHPLLYLSNIYPPIHPPVHPSLCLSIHPPTCPSIYSLSTIHSLIYPPVHLPVYA